MNKDELVEEYFEWMCRLVCNRQYPKRKFHKLLQHLFEYVFHPVIPMDENRACDGVNLRYYFGYDNEYEQAMIASELDDRPCSILEMMIALAVNEESIMSDPNIGDRTSQWFWSMVSSLELDDMNDIDYNWRYVEECLDRFINRKYRRDGLGGLFYIPYIEHDMREVEIWYQMNWYLDTIVEGE